MFAVATSLAACAILASLSPAAAQIVELPAPPPAATAEVVYKLHGNNGRVTNDEGYTKMFQATFPIPAGKTVSEIHVGTDWWAKRPKGITVCADAACNEVLGEGDFSQYDGTICGLNGDTKCSYPNVDGSAKATLRVSLNAAAVGAAIAGGSPKGSFTAFVRSTGLLSLPNKYVILESLRFQLADQSTGILWHSNSESRSYSAGSESKDIDEIFQQLEVSTTTDAPAPATTAAATAAPTASMDMSGAVDFVFSATIKTTHGAGSIFAKAFANSDGSGLWKSGGSEGQAKMLFLRNSRLCFDIGWVGVICGSSNIADNKEHKVAVRFQDGRYKVVVDGKVESEGLRPIPDHPDLVLVVREQVGHSGKPASMAPRFSGAIENVHYGPLAAPCPLAATQQAQLAAMRAEAEQAKATTMEALVQIKAVDAMSLALEAELRGLDEQLAAAGCN